jgi:two-component system, NtrC family, response regulator AtoC
VIELIAASHEMRETMRMAKRVAGTDASLLITGESGTGKDALARFVHLHSKRARFPFVSIDCAALPAELLEAELFGYERGAFTGATHARAGRFEAAHRGTLVLDEIALLSVVAQAKLLRVIERGEFERLGGRRAVKIDARIIALTNVNLENAIKGRRFREDLFHRLNVVRIHLAPLRERIEDTRELALHFLKVFAEKHGRSVRKFSPEAFTALEKYDFPGNVRELAHTIERAVIVAEGAEIKSNDFPIAIRNTALAGKEREKILTLAEMEAGYITEILAAAKGNKSQAARALGISRKNLYEKIARYKLQKPE